MVCLRCSTCARLQSVNCVSCSQLACLQSAVAIAISAPQAAVTASGSVLGGSLPSSLTQHSHVQHHNHSSSLSVSPLFQPSPLVHTAACRWPAARPSAGIVDSLASSAPSSHLPFPCPAPATVSAPRPVAQLAPAASPSSSGAFVGGGSAPCGDEMEETVNGPGDRRSRRTASSVSAVTRLLRNPACALALLCAVDVHTFQCACMVQDGMLAHTQRCHGFMHYSSASLLQVMRVVSELTSLMSWFPCAARNANVHPTKYRGVCLSTPAMFAPVCMHAVVLELCIMLHTVGQATTRPCMSRKAPEFLRFVV